jgi:hypothetical protein
MNAERFRAYAAETRSAAAKSRSRMPTAPSVFKRPMSTHEVHNPVVEGELVDGVAKFTAKVPRSPTSLLRRRSGAGSLPRPRSTARSDPERLSVSFADVPVEEPVDLGNGEYEINGTVYRKAD